MACFATCLTGYVDSSWLSVICVFVFLLLLLLLLLEVKLTAPLLLLPELISMSSACFFFVVSAEDNELCSVQAL